MSITEKNRGNLVSKLVANRIWVQSAFLLAWLDPLALRLHNVCGPVFHCYSCPLATFACPIGVIASFSVLHLFPFLAVGTLVLGGAMLGGLICGWACPFGLLQDLAARVNLPKFNLPRHIGIVRYFVLGVAVLAVPYFFGEANPLFICRLCPAGAMEGAIPNVARSALSAQATVWPSIAKISILVIVMAAMFFIHRPWCRILCPLGAIFGIFNRVAGLTLKLNPTACTACGKCRDYCRYGLDPAKDFRSSACVRCLGCTKCESNAVTLSALSKNSCN